LASHALCSELESLDCWYISRLTERSFYPTTASVSQRFTTHRGLAMGLVATGSSIGGIVWPIMVDSLLKKTGFGWTMRICGFFALALLLIANFLVLELKQLRGTAAAARAKMQAEGTALKFAEPRYVLFTTGFFFVYFGLFIPYYYLPTYGMERGMSSSMAAYLVAILNAGSFIGRAGIGYASDRLGRFVYNSKLQSIN
jgi:MFS transporter, MCT family, aspergillic acid transporter